MLYHHDLGLVKRILDTSARWLLLNPNAPRTYCLAAIAVLLDAHFALIDATNGLIDELCRMIDTHFALIDASNGLIDGLCTMIDAHCAMIDAHFALIDASNGLIDGLCTMIDAHCAMIDAPYCLIDRLCRLIDATVQWIDASVQLSGASAQWIDPTVSWIGERRAFAKKKAVPFGTAFFLLLKTYLIYLTWITFPVFTPSEVDNL